MCPYNPLCPRVQEELESYPLGSVRDCAALLDACSYDSVLAVSVQEQSPPGTSVLLFQCDRIGVRQGLGVEGGEAGAAHQGGRLMVLLGLCQAQTLKSSLEKLVKQCKEEQNQYGHR